MGKISNISAMALAICKANLRGRTYAAGARTNCIPKMRITCSRARLIRRINAVRNAFPKNRLPVSFARDNPNTNAPLCVLMLIYPIDAFGKKLAIPLIALSDLT